MLEQRSRLGGWGSGYGSDTVPGGASGYSGPSGWGRAASGRGGYLSKEYNASVPENRGFGDRYGKKRSAAYERTASMLTEMEAIADDPEGYMNGKVSGEDYMEYVRNRMDGRMDSGFGSGYGRPAAPKAPVRPAGGGVTSSPRPAAASTGPKHYEPGDIVEHKVFGRGKVLKVKPADLAGKIQSNLDEIKELKRQIEQYQAKDASGAVEKLLESAKEIGGVKVLTAKVSGMDAAKLRQMGDMLRDKQPNVVAVLSAVNDGKITFLAVCGKEAVSKGVKAGDIIKNVTAICGGKGGGKPDSAMGGGNDLLKLDDALAKVDDLVAEKLGL